MGERLLTERFDAANPNHVDVVANSAADYLHLPTTDKTAAAAALCAKLNSEQSDYTYRAQRMTDDKVRIFCEPVVRRSLTD